MQITRPRWGLAETEANKLAGPYSSPPIPVLEIAESNGVNVIFADFGENSEKVTTTQIKDRDAIFDALKVFLGKGK